MEEHKLENKLDNALCTCFLENITQTKSGEYARQFMRRKSKSSFDKSNI